MLLMSHMFSVGNKIRQAKKKKENLLIMQQYILDCIVLKYSPTVSLKWLFNGINTKLPSLFK